MDPYIANAHLERVGFRYRLLVTILVAPQNFFVLQFRAQDCSVKEILSDYVSPGH